MNNYNIQQQPIQKNHHGLSLHSNNLCLPTNNGQFLVQKNDIKYLKADSNYCKIFLSNGKRLLFSKTLKFIQNRIFESHFIRVHHSYVVNFYYVTQIDSAFKWLYLKDGTKIPISRNKKANLKAAISWSILY